MTAADRDANLARMVTPWSPPQPIEELFKQLHDGQQLTVMANEPITNTNLARMGHTIILKTGLFSDGCREWALIPEAQQTWLTPILPLPLTDNTPAATANTAAIVPNANYLALLMAELTRLLAHANKVLPSATSVARGYCWTHRSTTSAAHTSVYCKNRAEGHKDLATCGEKNWEVIRMRMSHHPVAAAVLPNEPVGRLL
jgi:hypothetical protein